MVCYNQNRKFGEMMGKPKWMIKREEKRTAAVREAARYVAEVNEKIDNAIQELRDKTCQIENDNKRELLLQEVERTIKSLKKSLEDAPKISLNIQQFKETYDLVYSQVKGMIKTIDQVLLEESSKTRKSHK